LAAGGATQQLPVVQPAVSRSGRWPHCRTIIVAEHRRRRPQQHALASQRRRAAQDVRTPTVPSVSVGLSSVHPSSVWRPVRVHRPPDRVRASGVARPVSDAGVARPVSSVRCPVPGVRCPMPDARCPVSGVDVGYPVSSARCPVSDARRRASGVQCPVSTSGVRCPVQASGIHACRVCVRSVRTGEFMECEGAVAATRLRTGRVGVSPHHVCDQLVGCPTGLESGTSLVRDNQALILTSRNVDNVLLSCAFRTP
jgi:hypothetical protein